MFSKSAALYDAIYTRMKNYESESAQVRDLVRKLRPAAKTMLDVACGTGEHAKYLKADFQVDGIDLNPEFVAIAQSKNQDGLYEVADMTDFDLGRRYDVVTCLFSAIGYAGTRQKLGKAIRCFARHLNGDGLVIVEPWLTPENWIAGRPFMTTVSEDDLKVCRMNISETRKGNRSFMKFHYLVGTPSGVTHFTENHNAGLFTIDQMKRAFSRAGLAAQYDEQGIFGRGLYVANLLHPAPAQK